MFSFFKRKTAPLEVDPNTNELLIKSAEMLHIQLTPCKSNSVRYEKFISDPFFTGYAIGFFDATLQYSGRRPLDDENVFKLLLIGFSHFFNGDKIKALMHCEIFLKNQDNPDFDDARMVGGKEYYESMDSKTGLPSTLISKYYST